MARYYMKEGGGNGGGKNGKSAAQRSSERKKGRAIRAAVNSGKSASVYDFDNLPF